MRRAFLAAALLCAASSARADNDNTSGVDSALFRSSYDTNGIFAVEGARLLPAHDLSLKVLLGYGHAPISVAVPGIGGPTDTHVDHILKQATTLDLAFGMSLAKRIAIGIDVAAYRASTGAGYGVRGRYASGGIVAVRSTGLIALRPLSNIDPSATPGGGAYLGDELAGPLDARFALKAGLVQSSHLAIALLGTVALPFGEDEMLLGDRDVVVEPQLAIEVRPDPTRGTRIVANASARFRKRTVLESYDSADPTKTEDDARVMLDVGGESVLGLGGVLELGPRLSLAGEVQAFLPLAATNYGSCHRANGDRCSVLTKADYAPGASEGDTVVLGTAGVLVRATPDVTATAMLGTSVGGARGDDIRITVGMQWAPQVAGAAAPGHDDRDHDGVVDAADGCADEPEDRDGFQDEDGCPDEDNDSDGIADAQDRCPDEAEDKDGHADIDGCPERDNDSDGILDVADQCPDEAEDNDGFEDEDGCPDNDNDGDGFKDLQDKCPNDAETVNGIDDDDGCPDVRSSTGPEERGDRIDLKGQPIPFTKGATLSATGKRVLDQVATIIKSRHLLLRVEVHVALGTKSTKASAITAQHKRDRQLALQRAKAIVTYLTAQGIPKGVLDPIGVGSDGPLPGIEPTNDQNERVDLIKRAGSAP